MVLGSESVSRQTFNLAADINDISVDDFRTTLRGIVIEHIQAQAALGNDQFTTTVDNRTAKPVLEAERKVIVLWGAIIGRMLMSIAKEVLIKAIDNSLGVRSGKLRNPSNWEWVYIPGGGKTKEGVKVNPSDIPSFGYDDRLVLRPRGDMIPYAWFANWRSVGGGRNTTTRRVRKDGQTTKVTSNIGFMAKAAEELRRRGELKQFSIYAGFSRRFAPSGAARMGQPFLMVRLKMRGRLK